MAEAVSSAAFWPAWSLQRAAEESPSAAVGPSEAADGRSAGWTGDETSVRLLRMASVVETHRQYISSLLNCQRVGVELTTLLCPEAHAFAISSQTMTYTFHDL